MNVLPDPAWPVVALAAIQLVDGVLCLKPVSFIAACFDDVGFPRRWWPVTPVIKFAAAAGLLLGTRVPVIAGLTSAALVAYFVLAVGAHLRARDYSRNLFVNATGMLLVCTATTVYCFLR